MAIEPTVLLVLAVGLAIGAIVGWLASRQKQIQLQTELEKDRAVHAERLKAYHEAETKLRDAFQTLSADALKRNNEAFLTLAETRLREARTEATSGIDAGRRDREVFALSQKCRARTAKIQDASGGAWNRRPVAAGIASLDTVGQNLRRDARFTDALGRPGVRRGSELQRSAVELRAWWSTVTSPNSRRSTAKTVIRLDVIVQLLGGSTSSSMPKCR